jgi:hypothetical protein
MKFLRTTVAVAALAAAQITVMGAASTAHAARAYIGTYTPEPGGSALDAAMAGRGHLSGEYR